MYSEYIFMKEKDQARRHLCRIMLIHADDDGDWKHGLIDERLNDVWLVIRAVLAHF